MSDEVLTTFRSLQALFAEERAEIAQQLWQTLPNIKEELFTYYDRELFEDIRARIEHVRLNGPMRLTPDGAELCKQVLALPHEERLEVVHLLWQGLPSMYGLFGEDDPAFIREINRRMEETESGRTKAIPLEEVMRQLKEKHE